MARQKCTSKWQGKSVRLNGKTKVYRLNAHGKSVRLNERHGVLLERKNCTFKWKNKSVRLNGKAKVYD